MQVLFESDHWNYIDNYDMYYVVETRHCLVCKIYIINNKIMVSLSMASAIHQIIKFFRSQI